METINKAVVHKEVHSAVTADTLEELARKMDVDPEAFTATIRRWIADDRRKAAPVARDRDYSVREGDTV